MAKRKACCKNSTWKAIVWTLIAVVLLGGVGYGVYRLVDHFKPTNKGQTEQVPEDKDTPTTTPEEQIANHAIEEHVA